LGKEEIGSGRLRRGRNTNTQRHCLDDGAFYFHIDGYADKTTSTLELPTLGTDWATDAINTLLELGAAE
jgi:hypothetical protein